METPSGTPKKTSTGPIKENALKHCVQVYVRHPTEHINQSDQDTLPAGSIFFRPPRKQDGDTFGNMNTRGLTGMLVCQGEGAQPPVFHTYFVCPVTDQNQRRMHSSVALNDPLSFHSHVLTHHNTSTFCDLAVRFTEQQKGCRKPPGKTFGLGHSQRNPCALNPLKSLPRSLTLPTSLRFIARCKLPASTCPIWFLRQWPAPAVKTSAHHPGSG